MEIAKRVAKGVGVAAALLLVAFLLIAFVPVAGPDTSKVQLDDSESYEQALETFASIELREATEFQILEKCKSQLFTHDEKVERTVVLFHGLTNCPAQFVDFGQELYSQGANVLILRAPFHGYIDEETGTIESVDVVGALEAEDIVAHVNESVDIAQGLGEQVEVIGLSMGGVQALVAATYRDDVDKVTAIAPAVSIPGAPLFATRALINVGNRLPNVSLPSGGADIDHTYKGESTGALSAMFLVARDTLAKVQDDGVKADLTIVLNPADTQVDNEYVKAQLTDVNDADGTTSIVSLPDIGLPHDVIDKDQPLQNTAVVYPQLYQAAGFEG